MIVGFYKSQRICFLLLLLSLFPAFFMGCGSNTADTPALGATVPIMTFSDIHFTPFYDPEIFFDLVEASPDEWESIFDASSVTEPASWGMDTNYPLLKSLLEAGYAASREGPLVIFQGDILTGKFREKFFTLYGMEDEAALRLFTYKTLDFFTTQTRRHFHDLPVVFVLGNHDAYAGDYSLIPDGEFLAETSDLFYEGLLLKGADYGKFKETYLAGGYYEAEPGSTKILFLCLNTVLFSVHWSGNDDAPARQLDWLEKTLGQARDEGKKVWFVMHVPPGADVYATVSTHMDDAGRISDAAMMWKDIYRERFLKIINTYSSDIKAIFASHTHMDEYRIAMPEKEKTPGAIMMTPSLSPRYGNNPAFKVFTMTRDRWALLDYRSMVFQPETLNPSFETDYVFSDAYHLEGALETSLAALFPELATDEDFQKDYIHFYYSGHDAGNNINNVNWPAYWCAIGNMLPDDYVSCVNGY